MATKKAKRAAKVGESVKRAPGKTKASGKSAPKRVKAGTSKAEAAARKTRFIEAFIANNGNGTQAYKTAGFTAKNDHVAGSEAYKLLKDPEIAAEIVRRRAEVIAEAEKITGVSVARTLRELGRIAYADPRKFFNADGSLKKVTELDDDSAAALASFEIDEITAGRGENALVIGETKKLKFHDKNSGIEKAMKHLGLFKEDNHQQGDAAVRALLAAVGANAGQFAVKP